MDLSIGVLGSAFNSLLSLMGNHQYSELHAMTILRRKLADLSRREITDIRLLEKTGSNVQSVEAVFKQGYIERTLEARTAFAAILASSVNNFSF